MSFIPPRITPGSGVGPGGLVWLDYALMISLPIGAYIAGRHWFNGPLFLIYGALGMYLSVHAFLSNTRLGLAYAYGSRSLKSDFTICAIAVVIAAIICNLMGKMGRKAHRSASTENDVSNG